MNHDSTSPRSLLADLEHQLLGSPRYTHDQLLEAAGVEPERADRLWRAMGFPEPDGDAVFFSDRDLDGLCGADRLLSTGLLKRDEAEAVTRAVAQSLARLADWQVGMLQRLVLSGDGPADVAGILELVGEVLPALEEAQAYAWRRHLAAAVARLLAPIEAGPDAGSHEPPFRPATVGFADMVGFTAATRQMSRDDLSNVLERFEEATAAVIVDGRGRIVKTIGDEVMFVTDVRADAAEIALRLVEVFRHEPVLPELRIGLASGIVLTRLGDVFGEVVNIASRLTANAVPGTVLVDVELATSLRGDPRYELHGMAPITVRGYQNLDSWTLCRSGSTVGRQTPTDR